MFARSKHLALTVGLTASLASLVAGCGGGGGNRAHDRASAAVTSGTGTGLLPPGFTGAAATPAGSLDPDNDGLTNDEEKLFGTDPNNPDTDGDGIMDGRDLAPLFGAAGYGPFESQYPRGAVATSATAAERWLRRRAGIGPRCRGHALRSGVARCRTMWISWTSAFAWRESPRYGMPRKR